MEDYGFYSYSILTGVWNDLSLDILLLVKEYLRIHLDRRKLNKEYDKFLVKVVKIIYERKKDINYCGHILNTRYGLKYTYGAMDYRRMCFNPYEIDWNHKFKRKFYINGTQIFNRNYEIHYEWGFYAEDQLKFIEAYEEEHKPFEKNRIIGFHCTSNKKYLQSIIRRLMDEEEKIICSC